MPSALLSRSCEPPSLVLLLDAHPHAAHTPDQRRAVNAILSCRTPPRGGHFYRCGDCQRVHFAYHSCHHRACPNCGTLPAQDWLAERKLRLLPVPYFLQTYTVPEGLRPGFQAEPKFCYHLLFAVSARALREVALSKLGGEPAALGVLHTWSRQRVLHPHVHSCPAAFSRRINGAGFGSRTRTSCCPNGS